MPLTEVSTAQLLNVSKKVNDLIENYKRSVNKVYEIGAEIDGMWDGEANQKFNAILGADREKFNAMSTLISEYSRMLNETAATYARTEAEVLETLNSKSGK